MRKGGGRRRVGQVIGWNVNRLNRCDRPGFGRCDPLLHRAHIGCQSWLIAHRRGNTSQKRRHLRASLCEAEDIVHKEQNIRTGFITELLSQGQTGQCDPHTCPWRLVHLAINQSNF